MGYTKTCEGCSKSITWVYSQARGSGFFAEKESPDVRHLCPRYDILKSGSEHHNPTGAHEQTIDTILRKISRIENTVAEIRMKLESQLPIDVRQ